MSLTADGARLLAKAEETLQAHRELIEEATRIKGRVTGKIRLGTVSNPNGEMLGRLLTTLSERCPEVEVALQHGNSVDVLAGIRNGSLDAGFYNEAGTPPAELTIIEAARFSIYLAAPPGIVATGNPPDWRALAELPWICPTTGTCCGRVAEMLFETHDIRPKRIVSVDQEGVTRTLIAGGVGIGLLHADSAREAEKRGEAELICAAGDAVTVLFAHLSGRSSDPILNAVTSILPALSQPA
jgi:DNA-binding transcriptional LysR family regulator